MLENIKILLNEFAPQVVDALLPPATDSEISVLQALVSKPLPLDLIGLYKTSAGQDNAKIANFVYGFPFLSIQRFTEVLEDFDYENDSNQLDYADKGICKDYTFSKSRIHIGDDCGTCVICVDLSPEDDGDYGQVILVDYKMNVALKLASSVEEYTNNFEQDLSSGKYQLQEDALDDGVQWLAPEREIEPGNWFNSPTWDYVKTS